MGAEDALHALNGTFYAQPEDTWIPHCVPRPRSLSSICREAGIRLVHDFVIQWRSGSPLKAFGCYPSSDFSVQSKADVELEAPLVDIAVKADLGSKRGFVEIRVCSNQLLHRD